MNRRAFIASAGIAVAGSTMWFKIPLLALNDRQREICEITLKRAVDQSMSRKPIGEVVRTIAESFLNSRYEANTLEQTGEEQLVVNLEVFDCVTLVENSLALARCIKKGDTSYDGYIAELRQIRYRGGVISGYPSRLHYFTDWIYDNELKGIVKDITNEIGGDRYRKAINFMSSNRSRYSQLSDDRSYGIIVDQEKAINERELFFIPKGNLHMYEHNIQDGDIIGITTNVTGLDIHHTAIAAGKAGRIHIIHAPEEGRTVEITQNNLMDYMALNPRSTGVMIARPQDIL
jgi:hypothetical protein